MVLVQALEADDLDRPEDRDKLLNQVNGEIEAIVENYDGKLIDDTDVVLALHDGNDKAVGRLIKQASNADNVTLHVRKVEP